MKGRIVVVDDDHGMATTIAAALARRDYECSVHDEPSGAFWATRHDDIDVVLTDVRMRGGDGIDLCARVVAERENLPVVVMTAFGSIETAVAALRAGAYDFISKPFELEVLVAAIDRAVEHRRLRGELRRLRREVTTARTGEMIGESAAMQRLREAIARMADSHATVLITGESGTGKELVARSLHATSSRRDGPMIAVNCAAVPEAMLESELFGHVRGAFTDARTTRRGLFAEASGGTLFLDEVGELPPVIQPKLLRVLQDRVVRPVGADRELEVDVRIVAATNRDLPALVAAGGFREDLLYRLDVLRIDVPPLRARGHDVLLLAAHFLARMAHRDGRPVPALSPGAARRILAHGWPGNVRELQNTLERAMALATSDSVSADDLPEGVRMPHVVVATDDASDLPTMEEVERRYIRRVLATVGNNKSAAARILGFDRATLYRKLERLDRE